MKTYIASFFVALTILQCSSAPASDSVESKESVEKKVVCEPKTSFKQGCNNCFCALDGSGFACTKMACPSNVYNEDGSLKPQPSATEAPVVENASETSEVIVETADANVETTEATSAVTSTDDLATTPKIPWGPLYAPGTPCPAKVFYSECNQCICGKDGVSAGCTLMLCDAFRSIYGKQNKDAAAVA